MSTEINDGSGNFLIEFVCVCVKTEEMNTCKHLK